MKKTALILLSLLLLVIHSCKKGDNIIEPTVPVAQDGTSLISSTIDDSEIGGNNLSVSSVYYPESPISNGSFKTIVSQEGTQVVLVTDGNNVLRGLSYTVKQGNTFELMPVDAISTINSLFLLTPGMTTTSPTETTELINILNSLPSYDKFRGLVQSNLQANTLAETLAKNDVAESFKDVVLEYYELQSDEESPDGGRTKADLYGTRLSVRKNDDGMVEISNGAFRKINVYRSYIDNDQVDDTQLLFENMDGGVASSWGSLFTLSTFEPTINVDETYFPPTQTTTTEYWIIGPGTAESQETPPSYVNTNYDEVLAKTIIYYGLYPLFDILTGTSKLIGKNELLNTIWSNYKEFERLEKLKNASTEKAFNRELIAYLINIGKLAISIPSVASTIGVSTGTASTIGTALTILSLPMSVANLSAFTADYFKQPRYSKFIINTPPDPPILIYPENEFEIHTTAPILTWQRNPVATSYMLDVTSDIDFENSIFKKNIGNDTSKEITDLEVSKTYHWRVSSTNNNGTSSWSETRSFVVGEVDDVENNIWMQKTDFPGNARGATATFSIDGKGYFGLGSQCLWNDTGRMTEDFWEYDPTTDSWIQKNNFSGGPKYAGISFTIGSKGYVGLGKGWYEEDTYVTDFWEYNPQLDNWVEKNHIPIQARYSAIAFSILDKGYVGLGISESGEFLVDFWEYNPESDSWSQRADFPGIPRSSPVGLAIENKGYVGTGNAAKYPTPQNNLRDFWEYDPQLDSWTRKTDFPGEVRNQAIGFSVNNKGYFGLGYSGSEVLEDIYEYEPNSGFWKRLVELPTLPYTGRCFAISGKGYIVSEAQCTNYLWEYAP